MTYRSPIEASWKKFLDSETGALTWSHSIEALEKCAFNRSTVLAIFCHFFRLGWEAAHTDLNPAIRHEAAIAAMSALIQVCHQDNTEFDAAEAVACADALMDKLRGERS